MTQCKTPQGAEGRAGRRGMKSLVMPEDVGGEGPGSCHAKSVGLPDMRSQPVHSTSSPAQSLVWVDTVVPV